MSFFKNGFLRNQWLFAHVMAGGIFAKVAPSLSEGMEPSTVIGFVLLGSIIWEIIEGMATDIDHKYGDRKLFFLDAFGDVIGAVIMAAIVVF